MPQQDTGGVPWVAQETAEMCFGGLACWDDLRAGIACPLRAPWVHAYHMFVSCQCSALGCVDIPGAVLNWWTTNKHPQKASIQKPQHSTCMHHTASQQGTNTTLELSTELSAACNSCPSSFSLFTTSNIAEVELHPCSLANGANTHDRRRAH